MKSASERFRMLSTITLAVAATACSGDDKGRAAGEDPEEHACEHVSVTGAAVTAADAPASAPAIAVADEPYTVTLVAGAPGYLKIAGPVIGLLFAGTTNVVNGLTLGVGGSDLLPEGAPNERCPAEIPEHFDLELDDTGDYLLTVGPAAVPSVWLMLTSAEGHAH